MRWAGLLTEGPRGGCPPSAARPNCLPLLACTLRCLAAKAARRGSPLDARGVVGAKQGCHQQRLSFPHCLRGSAPDRFNAVTQLSLSHLLVTKVC